MKKTVVLISFFMGLSAYAQNTSVSTMNQGVSSKGIRVSLLKPSLNVELKVSSGGKSGKSDNVSFGDSTGLSVGYANLPVGQLGWTTNLSLIDTKVDKTNLNFTRLDGNLAYAFTPVVNAKGGLNYSKITKGDDQNVFTPAIGLQASVGFQVTKNFGIDVGYTQMNQRVEANVDGNDMDFDFKFSGVEIGINGTF